MNARFVAVLTLSLTILAGGVAAAQGHDDDQLIPAVTEDRSYGQHIVLTDVAVLATALAFGYGVSEEHGEYAAIYGLLLSGPAVHALHGRGWRAAASFGLRVGTPLVGFVVVSGLCGGESLGCAGRAMVAGLAVFAGAVAIDALVLAKDKVVKDSGMALRYRGIEATPNFAVAKNGGLTLGLNGTF